MELIVMVAMYLLVLMFIGAGFMYASFLCLRFSRTTNQR